MLFKIAVAQLSINGTTVDSVTDRTYEPQYHVKEDAGSITLCIRVESFPEEKDNLTISYFTSPRSACKYSNTLLIFLLTIRSHSDIHYTLLMSILHKG